MTESNNTRRTPFRARREKDEENIRIGISQGDVNGAVIMLSGDDNEFATSEQSALVQAAAMYFGKQMEE